MKIKIVFAFVCVCMFAGIASAQCTTPAFTGTEHGASMCWGASPTPNITSYNVYRAPGACSVTPLVWTKLATTLPTVLVYKDLTAAPGVTYCFTFTATDANGESDKLLGAKQLELTPPKLVIGPPPPPQPPLPPGSPSGVGN